MNMPHSPFPTPSQLRKELPLTCSLEEMISTQRQIAQSILQGRDGRFAIIVGPCSIHDTKAALEYAERLQKLGQKVASTCFLIMRIYLEKPRSSVGWKGFLYDPHLDESYDMQTGLYQGRELLLTLTKMGVPVATEFLDPLLAPYIEDLVTWGFIGARTSASPLHRQLASLFPFPIGFKNGIDGSLDSAIESAFCAGHPQVFIHTDLEGRLCRKKSSGNPWTHLVLRGSRDKPNYDEQSIHSALEKLEQKGITKRVLIDCSHGNCQKDYRKQKEVFFQVLESWKKAPQAILGVMLESFLQAGSQLSGKKEEYTYGVSITDPCIDWGMTEELILSVAECVSSASSSKGVTQS